MSYYTEIISPSANIPAADGVACALHEGTGNLQMFGGVYTSTNNHYRQAHKSNPAIWSNPITLPCSPCHVANLVYSAYYDRTFKLFGDQWSKPSQKEFWSIDGAVADFAMHSEDAPWAGIGGYAAARGKYIYAWGGQTNAAYVYQDSTAFMLKLWRWSMDDGFELVTEKLVSGIRGFSGQPALAGNKAFMLNGGAFETWDFPALWRGDMMALDLVTHEVTLHNARLPYSNRRFNTHFAWDDNIWDCFGWNGSADMREIRRTPDLGATFIRETDSVGPATHAAGCWPLDDGVIFATGSHYGPQVWALRSTDIGGYHYNINYAGGTTGFWAQEYAHLDREMAVETGVEIEFVRVYSLGARTYTPFILKENSPTNYDAAWVGDPVAHPGGGIWVNVPCGVTLPAGTYRQGQSAAWGGAQEAFVGGGYSRAWRAGTVLANDMNLTFATAADGTFPVSYKTA